eukprot:TRINITY_DN28395_c0_g1_i3.p1 TRINITY_DN28395_c0_g1~~TRINITY_DN28395_c0_g1_i3.p1  ORF type:complete len:227 (+),score=19.61 TRINITY_DN28395_c0_g1_i3:63-743(+)
MAAMRGGMVDRASALWASASIVTLGAMYLVSGRHLFVVKHVSLAGALCVIEDRVLRPLCGALYGHAGGPLNGAPRAYALVWLINGIASSFVLLVLGMRVGKARRQYGVPLPQMYATGDSADAVAFNCVQRGHQHAFETYTSFVALSLIGGVQYPITVALAGVVWAFGRLQYATAYAAAGPKGKMSFTGARGIWWSLLAVATASGITAARHLCAPERRRQVDAHDDL